MLSRTCSSDRPARTTPTWRSLVRVPGDFRLSAGGQELFAVATAARGAGDERHLLDHGPVRQARVRCCGRAPSLRQARSPTTSSSACWHTSVLRRCTAFWTQPARRCSRTCTAVTRASSSSRARSKPIAIATAASTRCHSYTRTQAVESLYTEERAHFCCLSDQCTKPRSPCCLAACSQTRRCSRGQDNGVVVEAGRHRPIPDAYQLLAAYRAAGYRDDPLAHGQTIAHRVLHDTAVSRAS